jgi:hypothetical protein
MANAQMAAALFDTVPEHDFIHASKGEQGAKNVVDFLNLQRNEVARATHIAVSSVRYDARIPHKLKERLQEIGTIINLVAEQFDGDLEKTKLWFETENPLLGHMSPRQMICYGRYAKLKQHVLNVKSGYMP